MNDLTEMTIDDTVDAEPETPDTIQEARLWRDDGWTARVIKNEEDDGWAVEMTMDGESDPALVGPWTMGRDKKNPKPLDAPSFHTLVKTASEVLRRHEQQLHAQLHKKIWIDLHSTTYCVLLDIVPDEDDPYAWLSARDADGKELGRVQVAPSYRLNKDSATAWVEGGFCRPRDSGRGND